MRLPLAAAALAVLLATPSHAAEPLNGWFVALDSCEAYLSKNKRTNPGDIRVEDRRAYEMLAINKAGGDFFQVRVPGAPDSSARWVSTACGLHLVDAETRVAKPALDTLPLFPARGARGESTDTLLALSWQPSFCEYRPNRPECLELNAGNLPAAGRTLSIHGLWPQPNGTFYCGVSRMLVRLDSGGDWLALPAPEIDADTRAALDAAMPGAMSQLDRHEWIKHGTCYNAAGGADEYYDDTLRLTDAINASAVGDFLAANAGREIDTADLRAAFDDAFGPGAGDRIQTACRGDDGRVLIREVTIPLIGEIGPQPDMAALILAAPPRSPGCRRGVLDAPGLQ